MSQTTQSTATQNQASYFNLHIEGLGYLSNIREIITANQRAYIPISGTEISISPLVLWIELIVISVYINGNNRLDSLW